MSFCAPCVDSARPPGMTMEASAPHCLRSYPGKRAFLKRPTNAPLSSINALSIGEKFLRETQYYFYCETPANSHKRSDRSDQITIRNTISDTAPLRTVTDFYPVPAKVKHQLEASLQKTQFNMPAIAPLSDSAKSFFTPDGGKNNKQTPMILMPFYNGPRIFKQRIIKNFCYYHPCDYYNQRWKHLLSLNLSSMYLVQFIWFLPPWFLESAAIQSKPLFCNLKCSLVSSLSSAYWACISRNNILGPLPCASRVTTRVSSETTLHFQL